MAYATGTGFESHTPTTDLITRHAGARGWAEARGLHIDRLVDHLDPADVRTGDIILGTLPVNLAAEVCARGGRYVHPSLELPRDWRGKELTAEDMRRFGARLEEFHIEKTQGTDK